MKIPKKNKMKKPNNRKSAMKPKKPPMKPKKEQVHIVAHEIKFARLLSGNEKKTRDRALKTLKKWLLNCFEKGYEFKEDDFLRIWKGLFYAVWMSDKPLVQEELCENISGILDLFPPEQYQYALMMVKVGLQAMATEWYGIDHHRMDKCLMLVRRYLRGSLRCVARSAWSKDACQMYAKMLGGNNGILALKTPMYARNAISMILHVIDCYLEEIAKVSGGAVPAASLVALLAPLCAYMCSGREPAVCAASRRALTALLRQSGAGLRYRDRTRAWEQMGCPEGGPDALQEVPDEDEEMDDGVQSDDDDREKPLDPRAGHVDVILSPLPVPGKEIAALLTQLKAKASGKAFKRLSITIQRFEQLTDDHYPLKVEELPDEGPSLPAPEQVVKSLNSLEKQLMTTSDELALRGLSRKHRKRLLAKSRAGLSIVEDAAELAAQRHNAAGDWLVEETKQETKTSKNQKQNSSNKENLDKKRKKRKIEVNGDATNKKRKIDNKTENTNSNKEQKNTKKNAPKIITTPKSIKPTETKEKPKKIKTEVAAKTPEAKPIIKKQKSAPTVVSKKVKKFQKQLSSPEMSSEDGTPKKVKFVLKNNSMQETVDYYKSVRQSPNIPFDSKREPTKTNLKPCSTPSPINPFFKKKWKLH